MQRVELKKTGKKCRVCKGDIVHKITYDSPPFTMSTPIGPRISEVPTDRGYHCDSCNIKYELDE